MVHSAVVSFTVPFPKEARRRWTHNTFIAGDEQRLSHFTVKKRSISSRISPNFKSGTKAAFFASSRAIGIPQRWYNLTTDLPVKPPPPLHPKTFELVKPEDLSQLFPDELIEQEASNDQFKDIPEEVLDVYSLWRPTPLRAKILEKLLDTPARIYNKYEGVSPAGSHKPNTCSSSLDAQQGVKNLVTETGAAQWGSSLAFACSLFGLYCEVTKAKIITKVCV